ncbi:MAG: heavy metal translocating P-type ATPase [Christensenellales bacterium]
MSEYPHTHAKGRSCKDGRCSIVAPEKDSCGCAHGHGHESKETLYRAIGATGLLIAAFIVPQGLWRILLTALCALLAGYEVLLCGAKSIVKLDFNEQVLMGIASVAAFILGEYVEAALILLLFAYGHYLEDLAVSKSRAGLRVLMDIRPDKALVLTDGREVETAAAEVPVGSLILIRPGDRIPLDCRVTQGASGVDASVITGESAPVDAKPGVELASGCINLSGVLTCEVVRPFEDSMASRIIRLVEESAGQSSPAELAITRFSRVYTPIVLAAAALLAVVPPLLGLGAFSVWVYRALVVLVASCPCAIVISVPLAYYCGIGAASRFGVLVKGGRYLETLAHAKSIAFDKTGTLTEGTLSVSEIFPFGGAGKDDVLRTAALCLKNSSHPIAGAVLRACGQVSGNVRDVSETAGQGIRANINGKRVLCGSRALLEGGGVDVNSIPSIDRPGTVVHVAEDGAYTGTLLLTDEVREDAADAIDALKKLGLSHQTILSGDNRATVDAVAWRLGIPEAYDSLLPGEKLDKLSELKQRAAPVLYAGDGINDAPVLTLADAGIAMGGGTDAAIESADVVLVSGRLNPLPRAISLSRRTLKVVYFNIAFALIVKALVLTLGALGWAPVWAAVAADVGVSFLSVLNATRALKF